MLAERLGPNKTLISNYPTPDAMKLCVGGMMERGGFLLANARSACLALVFYLLCRIILQHHDLVVRTDAGGSTEAIAAFGKQTCGLYDQPCLLDYHAQYFRTPADGKMAAFMLGMNKYGTVVFV